MSEQKKPIDERIKELEGTTKGKLLGTFYSALIMGPLIFGSLDLLYNGLDGEVGRVASSIASKPGKMLAARDKRLRDERNLQVIDVATAEYNEIMIQACEKHAKSRIEFVKCVKEVGR